MPAVATPVLWIWMPGTVWQALHSTGRDRVPSTWEACTPTPLKATVVFP